MNYFDLGNKATKVGHIYSGDATVFKKFRQLAGNRPLSEHKVTQLVKSLKADGYKKDRPMIINELNEIVEGQHRNEAAKRIALTDPSFTLYFIVIAGAGIKEAQEYNAQRPSAWKLDDHIFSFAQQGFPTFVRLDAYVKEKGLPASIIYLLLNSSTKTALGGMDYDKIKQKAENFVLTDENYQTADELLNMIEDLHEYEGHKTQKFIDCLLWLMKRSVNGRGNYDHSAFLRGWENWPTYLGNGRGGYVNTKVQIKERLGKILRDGQKKMRAEKKAIDRLEVA